MHLPPNSSRAALHTTTPSLPPKTPPPKDPACCTHTQAARSLSGAGLSLPRVMCPRLLVWPHRLIAPHAGCAASQHGVHPPSSCQVLSLHAARAGIGQERGCCVAEARAPAANPKPGAASLRGGRVRALQRAAATATATAVATAMGSSPLCCPRRDGPRPLGRSAVHSSSDPDAAAADRAEPRCVLFP